MDKFTKCYLNTILPNNTIQNKLKSKKKKILAESKSIITEQDVVYQNIPGQDVQIIIDQNGKIVEIKGAKQVDVTQKGQQVQAQITDDPELLKNLGLHKQQAKQLTPDQIKALQQGVGSDTWSSLKQGGAMVCNGFAYLIEGPGKILSWPFKALGTVISPQTKQYMVDKDYQQKAASALQQNGQAASQQQLDTLQSKSPEFLQALQNAPEGTILYDRVTGKCYRKFDGKFYFVPFRLPGMAGGTMQQNKQAIDKATQQAQANGISGDAGASAFTSADGRYIMGNPQLRNMFTSGCKKLKLKDKKSQGNFLQMISKMFMSMFGMNGEEGEDYQEYSDSQRMSFSPFVRKIVKNGTLPPGTYKFEYK